MPRLALQRSDMQCLTTQCHTMLWHATLCRALLRHAMPCCSTHRARALPRSLPCSLSDCE
eukprot:4494763-Pyramimonas_sp.AAC.1